VTRLNYEEMKRRCAPSDYIGDDLPRTGSWRDQIRYAAMKSNRQRKPLSNKNFLAKTRKDFNLDQLRLYVARAEEPGFARLYSFERAGIVSGIQTLKSRILAGGCADREPALLSRANALLRRYGS